MTVRFSPDEVSPPARSLSPRIDFERAGRISEIAFNYYRDSNASRPIPDCPAIDRKVPMRIS